jgi:hypothetical protein
MHILTAIVLTVGALAFLMWGLIRVLHDLLQRGPYDAPLVEESPRHEEPAAWRADREPGRNEVCR